jgi:hypothetical protein
MDLHPSFSSSNHSSSICEATGNKHLLWFGKLLDTHFEGIIAHATYKISSGKIEGINQKKRPYVGTGTAIQTMNTSS